MCNHAFTSLVDCTQHQVLFDNVHNLKKNMFFSISKTEYFWSDMKEIKYLVYIKTQLQHLW